MSCKLGKIVYIRRYTRVLQINKKKLYAQTPAVTHSHLSFAHSVVIENEKWRRMEILQIIVKYMGQWK